MADPWTDAWKEAEATCPPAAMIYYTLELIHPSFVHLAVPFSIRAVTGVTAPVMLTLEAGAPLDPNTSVEFSPIPFSSEYPAFEQGKTPESVITLDNVAREIVPYLDAAVMQRANLETIYREYRVDDVTAPCFGPVLFIVRNVKITGTRVQGTAKIDDLANMKFPRKVFTIAEFSSLIP